jgi:hypothetical protein
VTAANVELIMNHVGAGDEASDHFEAGAGVDAGVLGNLVLVNEDVAARGVGIEVFNLGADDYFFCGRGDDKLVVKDGSAVGRDEDGLRLGDETLCVESDDVLADGDSLEFEDAVGVGSGFLRVGGVGGLQCGMGIADGAMLRIVNHTAHVAEDSGEDSGGCQ